MYPRFLTGVALIIVWAVASVAVPGNGSLRVQSVPPTTAPGGGGPYQTPAPPADPAGVLTRHWGKLYLNGSPYRFVSLSAPSAATDWPVNWGCGAMATDAQLDALFAGLPPHTLVPFWATQAMAFNNKTTHAIDFSGIDRVFRAAEQYHQFLMPELETQQGYCSDGHWKDSSWYSGGYRGTFDDGRHLQPLSYWDYVHLIVPRYASSPALGMWELMVEPEGSSCNAGYSGALCYGYTTCNEAQASTALRAFFDKVGTEVKRLDPLHLIATGSQGDGQCGWAGTDYAYVNASPGVDVCEVHDYNGPQDPLDPSYQQDAPTCIAMGKPLIVGETGFNTAAAIPGAGCAQTLTARASAFSARINAYLADGASGLALWDWVLPGVGTCGYGITMDDPVLAIMRADQL